MGARILSGGIVQGGETTIAVTIKPLPQGFRRIGYKTSVRLSILPVCKADQGFFKGFFFVSVKKDADNAVSPHGEFGQIRGWHGYLL
jgi:hypothetical protein